MSDERISLASRLDEMPEIFRNGDLLAGEGDRREGERAVQIPWGREGQYITLLTEGRPEGILGRLKRWLARRS